MQQITFTLESKYLEKFKVFPEQTLFEPDLSVAIKQHRCIYCFNKLKFPMNRKVAVCNGKKHAKPFVISIDKLK